jgi:hypothetical protein
VITEEKLIWAESEIQRIEQIEMPEDYKQNKINKRKDR